MLPDSRSADLSADSKLSRITCLASSVSIFCFDFSLACSAFAIAFSFAIAFACALVFALTLASSLLAGLPGGPFGGICDSGSSYFGLSALPEDASAFDFAFAFAFAFVFSWIASICSTRSLTITFSSGISGGCNSLKPCAASCAFLPDFFVFYLSCLFYLVRPNLVVHLP